MRWTDQYIELIDKGKIIVCKDVELALKRAKKFEKKYIFKQEEADKRIDFIENECSNTKGSSKRLKLALPQKVWLEIPFGFYHNKKVTKTDLNTMQEYETYEERRLIHEMPLMVSRGSGKTTLGAAIAEVMQIIDGEYGADVQCLAYNREQAQFLYGAVRAMLTASGTVIYDLNQRELLKSTKTGIMYTPTNSLLSIKTSDYESLDGTNAHGNIFDEVHTYDEDFIKVVNDGSRKKRLNWLTWYLTTNGTKRGKLFDKMLVIWRKIVREEILNDSVFPLLYSIDDVKEIENPKMWQKAIPLLGITTEIETIKQEIEDAKNDPTQQAELLAKTFNLPVNNYQSYFTNEECLGNRELFEPKYFLGDEATSIRVILGIDLSDVNDICSVSFMIVENDKRYFLNKKYMPELSLSKVPRKQRIQYQEWAKEGLLTIHQYDNNDQKYIFDDIRNFMKDRHMFPILIGYDRWHSQEITKYFKEYYGDICKPVSMTVKELSNPMKIYKQKLLAKKIIFDDEVATWNHAGVVVKVDANMNIFPNKKKAANKIDVFMSQLIACIAYDDNKDKLKYYFN